LVLNVHAEKIHAEAAREYFQTLFDGKRLDSPNGIPYQFFPTYGNIFDEHDLPKILYDNSKHTEPHGVVLISGFHPMDTLVRLNNNISTTIRTILLNIPALRGSVYQKLFLQIEHQPNTDWIVCAYQTDDQDRVKTRLTSLYTSLKKLVPENQWDTIFSLPKLKFSGMQVLKTTTKKPRFTVNFVSQSAVNHTRNLVANLPQPPPKRTADHSPIEEDNRIRQPQKTATTSVWKTTPNPITPNGRSSVTTTQDPQTEANDACFQKIEDNIQQTNARLSNLENTCQKLDHQGAETLHHLKQLTEAFMRSIGTDKEEEQLEPSSKQMWHELNHSKQNDVLMQDSTAFFP
jgi:hypothetical protein